MGRSLELAGRRFGRLKVLHKVERAAAASHWLARCDCGVAKVVRNDALTSGRQISCGCHRREKIREALTAHGLSHHPEHAIWRSMIHRCHAPKCRHFKDYGGRGIIVCDRWRFGEDGRSGFECFLVDTGFRPSPESSLDRINNDGPYAPGNTRWATREQQANNRRSNRVVLYQGRELTLAQAVRAAGSVVTASAAASRLKNGWSVEEALETPVRRFLN